MAPTPGEKSRLSTIQSSLQARIGSLRKLFKSISCPPPSSHSTSLTSSSPSAFVIFGMLGSAGPLTERNVGSMVTDYVVWSSLFWQAAGVDKARSQFHSIRPIGGYFPDRKVVFGEASCDHLQLPVPPCLDQFDHSTLTETQFCGRCEIQLHRTANAVKPGETLIILLIGHGGIGASDEGWFRFYVTTGDESSRSVWISKYALELAVEECKGEIVVVCNSCREPGALKSPLWTLLCAASASELSDSLVTSASGYERGSVSTPCALAQAGKEQGSLFPLPRIEPRPWGAFCRKMKQLATPSFTSLPNSNSKLFKSSNHPYPKFLQGMLDVEHFSILDSKTHFHQSSSKNSAAWHHLIFTEKFVRGIEVYGFDPGKPELNSAYEYPAQEDISAEKLVKEQLCSNKTLLLLMEAYLQVPHSPLTREGRDAKLAADFLLLNVNRTIGLARDLMYILYTRHVQAAVVQELARYLGWWEVNDITPFFSIVDEERHTEHQIALEETGIPLNLLVLQLPPFFPGLFAVTDYASACWLAGRWADAGSPSITLQLWNFAVDKAAKSAKHRTLVTDEDDCKKLLLG